jgi:hypothetical protein
MVGCLIAIGHSAGKGPATLEVCGFYLGMPLADAVKAAADLVDITHYKVQPFNLEQYKFRTFEGNAHQLWFSDTRQSVVSPIAFATDGEKRVTFISIGGGLVNRLFQSQKTTAEDFVRSFADGHNLPQMTPFQKEQTSPLPKLLPHSGWRYRSPLGYKITIFSNKDLDIEKAGPPL